MDTLSHFHCVSNMQSLISKKISSVFDSHHLKISPECITQLSIIVLNVLNAVEKQNNDLTFSYHVKKLCSEKVTTTDIQLLIQYDIYQQLDRMKKDIHYPIIKDIGNCIMETIQQYNDNSVLFQPVKIKI